MPLACSSYADVAGAETAANFQTPIFLAASASAEFIADIGLCPLEAVKVLFLSACCQHNLTLELLLCCQKWSQVSCVHSVTPVCLVHMHSCLIEACSASHHTAWLLLNMYTYLVNDISL